MICPLSMKNPDYWAICKLGRRKCFNSNSQFLLRHVTNLVPRLIFDLPLIAKRCAGVEVGHVPLDVSLFWQYLKHLQVLIYGLLVQLIVLHISYY